jgi:hypothetical protein
MSLRNVCVLEKPHGITSKKMAFFKLRVLETPVDILLLYHLVGFSVRLLPKISHATICRNVNYFHALFEFSVRDNLRGLGAE